MPLPVQAWSCVPEQLVGWCPRPGSHWGTPAWRLSRRHQSRPKPCCKWPRLFLPGGGRDFCGGAPGAARWWSGRASKSWRASKKMTMTPSGLSSLVQARLFIKHFITKVGFTLRFDLPCDTVYVCCSMTPNRKGSAWRCWCRAVGMTAQKPVKVKNQSGQKNHDRPKSFPGTLAANLHPHTCMAAVNWASFSMVSSEAPFCTVIKTEFLKKYLQFWWSIWYNSSNISALTSGEDLCF